MLGVGKSIEKGSDVRCRQLCGDVGLDFSAQRPWRDREHVVVLHETVQSLTAAMAEHFG